MSVQSILVIIAAAGLIAGLIWNNRPDKREPDDSFVQDRPNDREDDVNGDDLPTLKHSSSIDKMEMHRQNYKNREDKS